MKRNLLIRGCALLLLVVLAATLVPMASAAGGSLYITGYTVTDAGGRPVGAITKGSTVNIAVSVKDISDGSGQGNLQSLDIAKLDDSFTGGTVTVRKTSPDGMPLVYEVLLTGVQYKGVGQALRFQVGSAGQPDTYQTMETTITEAVVYEAPQPVAPPPAEAPEPSPAPMVVISRSELEQPLRPGQEVELTVYFRNLSGPRLRSPVATFSPSEGLSIAGGASSFPLDDISGKKSVSLKLRVRAASVISSPNQSLGVELKYNYHNNVSMVQATANDKISIPALARESVPQPVVVTTRSAMDTPMSPGEIREITLSFANTSEARLVSPVLSVTPSEALVLKNDVSTFLMEDIAPGAAGTVTLKLQAAKDVASANQTVSTELKFAYDNGTALAQASVSDKINVPVDVPSKADAPTPNIVIRSFTYGESSVATGSAFPLGFTFVNTGKMGIENVVVTVDGGESFTMNNSTNTFYYPALSAGGSQTQEVPMRVVPTSKSGAQSITVGFKYEYVSGDKRTQANTDIRISVPVYQPDRFQINAPAVPETVTVGEETALTLAYVNKGRGDISNVEAVVEGDGVDTPARTQYLGNIIAGGSGNIGFALTPNQEGEIPLTLKISYENADQQLVTREFPVTLKAEEPPMVEETDFEEPEQGGGFPWLAVVLVIAGAGAGGGALWLRKRKKKAEAVTDGSWEDWDQTPGSEEA